jgi:hypothetical protein
MKKSLAIMLVLTAAVITYAEAPLSHMVGVGARYHQESSVYPDLPYGDGDISYLISYELHDTGSDYALQFALDFANDFSKDGTEEIDYTITPQMNIILKDKIWRGGLGMLYPYVKDEAGTDWGDLYYQVFAGLGHRVNNIEGTILAYYPFDSFGDFSDFETSEIEFGVFVSFAF